MEGENDSACNNYLNAVVERITSYLFYYFEMTKIISLW